MSKSKDAILIDALRVFGRLGVYKTTMNDIALAAKKGRRTIYQYFKSKEDIYEAVLEHETNNMVAPLIDIVSSDLSIEEKLRTYAYERIKSIYKIADKHYAFRVGFIQNDKVILNLRKRFDKIDTELLEKIIIEGKNNKSLKVDNVDLVVKNIQSALRGMEISFIRNDLNEDCRRQLDHFIDMILHGIVN